MNAIRIYIIATAFIASCFTANAQFVTLQNGEFWLAGERFYPEVVNNGVSWVFPSPTADPILKANSAGSENCPTNPPKPYCVRCSTETGCSTLMLAEFQQIASLGFNTIRFGVGPAYTLNGGEFDDDPYLLMPDNYVGFYYEGVLAENDTYKRLYKTLNYPYNPTLDLAVNVLFNNIENVLNIAQQAGLKVILLAGGGHVLTEQEPLSTDPYPVYLGQLANRLKNHPALFAYDLFNEPGTGEQPLSTVGSKQIVCQSTTNWYNAIKANDQNHLVTIGGGTHYDVMNWDPLIMKVDFISPHYYPPVDKRDNWNYENALNRYRIDLHWHYANFTKPWLLGETGFSAENGRDSGNPTIDDAPNEKLNGSEQQGKEFAHMSRKYAWDCNCQGYSWWNWRDSRPTNWLEADNYYGLIRMLHHPSTPAGRKPVVDEFLQNTPQDNPRGICEEPADYYNPWNLTNPNNRLTGTVLDQHGNPIANAVVIAHTFNSNGTTPTNGFKPSDTFTNEAGVFTVIPDDNVGTGPGSASMIHGFTISAPGANMVTTPWENAAAATNLVQNPIHLDRLELTTNTIIDSETVTSNTTESFVGNASLTMNNTQVQANGVADFRARNEVNAKNEFHASTGSETHLWCEEVSYECSELNGFLVQGRLSDPNLVEEENQPQQIELFFTHPRELITIYPNPGLGIFTIKFVGEGFDEATKRLIIQDIAGRVVLEMDGLDMTSQFDITHEARGLYLVTVKVSGSVDHELKQKIILQ